MNQEPQTLTENYSRVKKIQRQTTFFLTPRFVELLIEVEKFLCPSESWWPVSLARAKNLGVGLLA